MASKRGKYEDCIDRLAPLAPEPTYQAKVDEAKQKFAGLGATQLVDEYVMLRKDKEQLEAEVKAFNLRIEAVTQLLVLSQDKGEEAWGRYGVKPNALRMENGDTVRIKSEPYGQVKDKEAFRLWCIAPAEICRTCGGKALDEYHSDDPDGSNEKVHRFNPGGGLENQLQLWPSSMNAIVKERAAAGEAYPDGCEAFRKDTLVFVPAGGKDE